MDDCPSSFGCKLPLQPNPEFSSGFWAADTGHTDVLITFDSVMSTGVLPAVGNFTLKLAGVTRLVDTVEWNTPTELRLNSATGIPAVDPVTIELTLEDPGLHALGGKNVLPFGPETVPET